MKNQTPEKDNNTPQKNNKILIIGLVVLLLFIILASTQITFFAIQPIGAVPEGVTLVIPRGKGTKLFDSADGICLREMVSVSLFCRMAAISTVLENSEVLFKLPYIDFIYLSSTGGSRFVK